MKNKIKLIIIGIALLILLSNMILATENRTYELKLNYDRGIITFKDVIVKPSLAEEKAQPETGYKLELVSFTNEVLDSFKFEIPLTLFIDGIDPKTERLTGGTTQMNKTDFSLRIPYFKNGKTINLYNQNNTKILSIDVGYFAQLCPDNICEPHESYENCPQDCTPTSGQKDDYCDKLADKICDTDCRIEQDIDCKVTLKPEKKKFNWYFVVLAIIFMGIMIEAILIYRQRKQA